MNVLSLFDGISCGHLALDRAGIPINNYYASEIDKSAIAITQAHYPETIQLGDVSKLYTEHRPLMRMTRQSNGQKIILPQAVILDGETEAFESPTIDLIIGGSPCTSFSFIGTKAGMTTGTEEIYTLNRYLELKYDGVIFQGQSYLFWEYLRILNEVKPKYFLLENVRMDKKWEDVISENLGVSPIKINSSLVSAQNRPRLYWTNIPDVTIPADKGIIIDDILDKNADTTDVAYTKTVQKALPILQQRYGYIPERFNAYNTSKIGDKARALTAGGSPITSTCATLMFVPVYNGIHQIKDGILDDRYSSLLPDGTYNIRKLSVLEMERLQTLPDDYTAVSGVSENRRRHAIGNGWTVDVIAHIFTHLK